MHSQDKKSFLLEIDCEIIQYTYDNCYGENPIILASDHILTFNTLLSINGRKAIGRRFTASFKEDEFYFTEALAQNILRQFAGIKTISDIYDCPYTLDKNPGDTIEIKFSEKAKEIFEFLKDHAPKLLEYMSL